MAADATKPFIKEDGNEFVVPSGARISLKSGSTLALESGATATLAGTVTQSANQSIPSGTTVTYASGSTLAIASGASITGKQVKHITKSRLFNVDNGAATTLDDAVAKPSRAITITRAQVLYTTETAGTVAGATVQLGTTLGGTELVAATALTNSKAVGAVTALTLASAAVAADGTIFVRHTGIAATAAGEYYVEIEYTIDA